jgi:hypothetical protein
MKKYAPIWLFIFWAPVLRGQSYSAFAISDSLKQNADVVVRLDEQVTEIKSPDHITSRRHLIFTILNENGDRYASYRSDYDKFTTISYINATLYDAAGKEVKHFKKKDMQDLPLEDGESLINDDRYKISGFTFHSYPYTVDFEEEKEIATALGLRGWTLPRTVRVSLECSRYSIVAPKDYRIRYRMINADLAPVVTEKKDRITYSWEIKNLISVPDEPYAVPYTAYEPYMLVGPSDIEEDGYKGSMTTWNDYARFYSILQKGRDVLPDEVKAKVHALTDGIPGPEKKVSVLYDYLQKNTHYVSIQLGIGGLQAFDAMYVASKKYGDCKALSNFMVALLKEAGIKAYSVIIYGGKYPDDFVKDFTYDPFNHVICCVPLQKDTIWLECTSQSLPAGYLSDFTSNRYGLLIGENGGELVHTPAYLLPDNLQVREISAVLGDDGALNVKSETRYKAACQDKVEDFITRLSKEDQLRRLKSQFDLPTYDVKGFSYREDHNKRLPVIEESLDLTVRDYAQVSGKRIFINPNVLTRSGVKLIEDKDRALDVELRDEYCHVDSVQIAIPAGYETESRPRDIQLESKYGKYENRVVISADRIVYYRKFERYSGRFPRTEFNDVVKFYNEVYKSDHSKIVLVKKS